MVLTPDDRPSQKFAPDAAGKKIVAPKGVASTSRKSAPAERRAQATHPIESDHVERLPLRGSDAIATALAEFLMAVLDSRPR